MKNQQDSTNVRAKTSRSPQKPIEDIILQRIRCTSGNSKQMFFASPSKANQQPAQKVQKTPQMLVFAESAILQKFSRILDSKLAPAHEMLDRMQKKMADLQQLPVEKLSKSVAPNPELLNGIEQRFSSFFQQTIEHTRMTISQGVAYYNRNLTEREDQYKQQHDAITGTFMEASRSMIDSRMKLTITNHDRILKAVLRLKDQIQQNCDGLQSVNCELDKVSLYLERYLEEKQKEKEQQKGKRDQIDPEDLIELDEEEIIKILMERMNIPNLPDITYLPSTTIPKMQFKADIEVSETKPPKKPSEQK